METLLKAWCGSLNKRFLMLASNHPSLPEKATFLITHCPKRKKNERMRRKKEEERRIATDLLLSIQLSIADDDLSRKGYRKINKNTNKTKKKKNNENKNHKQKRLTHI